MSEPDIDKLLREFSLGIAGGKIQSFAPLLPFLCFEGQPFQLKKHFQMEPLFRMRAPRRNVLMSGRQVGKSQNFSAAVILKAGLTPHYHILVCEPSFSQMSNISTTIFRSLVHRSYIKNLMQDINCRDNVLLREFKSGSRVHFTYCGDDANRVRGIAGIHLLVCDETADMELDVINVAAETMSAVEAGGTYLFTGTPTYSDNTLNVLFQQSSGGELHFKCDHCNKTNIAGGDYDLYNMIGKETCVCAKCGKPLDVRKGWYEFERPEMRSTFDGFHVSQVTHPLHCTNYEKWKELLHKQKHFPPSQFANEILGIPCDESVKLLSKADLERATTGRPNNLEEAINNRKRYTNLVVGVDWGGGGIALESFTAVSVVGWMAREHRAEVLYMERYPVGMSVIDEVGKVLTLARTVRADLIAHDSTGAGKIREELLMQAGAKAQFTVIPFWYVWAPRQDTLVFHPPQPGFNSYYSLDKTRALSMMVAAIRAKQILLPEYKSADNLFKDFLALGEDIRKSGTETSYRVITRTGTNPDDVAHAVNFACQAIWHMNKTQPVLGELTKDM